MPETSVASILYATMASAFFGAQVVLTMRSLNYVDPQTSSMISMGTCVLIFWLLAPFLLRIEYFRNPGIWIFFANGLIHPLFSMYLAFEATKRMGATVSATIAATAPLFASAGAVLALGEHLTVALLIGTLGTVVGVMVLSWKRQGPTNWALSALLLPIGAAAIRGANHMVGKLGLEILPSPYFASLVSFTVSFTGAILIYRYRVGRLPLRLPRQGFKWSGLSGLSIAMGVLCMYTALHTGLVIVASPIISAYPLFTLFISLLFRQEVLSVRVLVGFILVLGGITWISLQ
jgi:drug/metabolite transporter (DMT)-like permease